MKTVLLTVAMAAALVACGEQPQDLGAGKRDATPQSGTGKAFVDEGWKQGDPASWQAHLKARAQRGQNDYSRMN